MFLVRSCQMTNRPHSPQWPIVVKVRPKTPKTAGCGREVEIVVEALANVPLLLLVGVIDDFVDFMMAGLTGCH